MVRVVGIKKNAVKEIVTPTNQFSPKDSNEKKPYPLERAGQRVVRKTM